MINKTEKEIMKNWIGSIDSPLVSVRCTTYNHEQYISDALDGFLMQETTFPFEVIVHDDASTDNTANIIKEYEGKYPNIIKPIYEEENQYSKHDGSITHIINKKSKGKYAAFCEGDDYWIDKDKLQKQIDVIEKNDNCSLVLTNCYEEDSKSLKRIRGNPYCNINRISNITKIETKDIILDKGSLPPTCSLLIPFKHIKTMPSFFSQAPVGDLPLRYYLATVGDIYYINEITCVHRMNVTGSFADRVNEKELAENVYQGMRVFYDKYNEYTNEEYNKEIEFVKICSEFNYYTRTRNIKGLIKNAYFINGFSFLNKIKIVLLLLIPRKLKTKIKKIVRD